jgi:hypothetical protein
MKKLEHEIIEIAIGAANTNHSFSQNTEAKHSTIRGIGIEFEDVAAIPGAKINLLIDGVEMFQSGFEASRLVCGDGVEPNRRYYFFEENIEINQKKISGVLTSGAIFNSAFAVNIYLLCDVKN